MMKPAPTKGRIEHLQLKGHPIRTINQEGFKSREDDRRDYGEVCVVSTECGILLFDTCMKKDGTEVIESMRRG